MNSHKEATCPIGGHSNPTKLRSSRRYGGSGNSSGLVAKCLPIVLLRTDERRNREWTTNESGSVTPLWEVRANVPADPETAPTDHV